MSSFELEQHIRTGLRSEKAVAAEVKADLLNLHFLVHPAAGADAFLCLSTAESSEKS